MLYTDKIEIKAATIDSKFNKISYGTETTVSAYIENNSKIKYGSDGQPYTPSYLIMVPPTTAVGLQDIIKIINIHGCDPIGDELGEKQIKQIRRIGGSRMSHLEIFV